MVTERPWDAIPNTALMNMFCRTSIKDRTQNLPLVCRSWSQASSHPFCWASMVADSYYSSSSAVDDAFVKESYPYNESFVDFLDGRRSSNLHRGVPRLQALIQRAAGGAAVTSLYFFPFLTSVDRDHLSPNDNELLRLIAQHCPNLKHLSFHGSYNASEEAIFEVIRSCRKLELVDFSDSPYFRPLVLEEMGFCCPNLRGIRRNGYMEPSLASTFSTGFPCLMILNLSGTPILDKDLLTIVTGCPRLQYLDVTQCQHLVYYMYIIKSASTRIAQIVYD